LVNYGTGTKALWNLKNELIGKLFGGPSIEDHVPDKNVVDIESKRNRNKPTILTIPTSPDIEFLSLN
jgi:hypothetical protein